jgi:hypothetical protein
MLINSIKVSSRKFSFRLSRIRTTMALIIIGIHLNHPMKELVDILVEI